jgi:hypothetical protein
MQRPTLFCVIDHLDDNVSFIYRAMEKVLEGGKVEFEEADRLLRTRDIMALADCANMITRKFSGDLVDVETLIRYKQISSIAYAHNYRTG